MVLFLIILAPPKFPSHVSKDLKSFLNCCLQKLPSRRLSAKKLLEHNLFKDSLTKQLSLKNIHKVIINSPANQLSHILNRQDINSQKMLKNYHFQIVDKKTKEIENDKNSPKNKDEQTSNKNLINIFADRQDTGGAFFSLSMTVYSQQSIVPNFNDFIPNNAKDNRILPTNIEEVEEEFNNSPIIKDEEKVESTPILKFNFINKKSENFSEEDQSNKISEQNENANNNQSLLSLKTFLDNHNINSLDLCDIENFDKLNAIELKKDEIQKLEAFFKERNGKASLGPI